jgi:hypothetical protein
MSSDVTEESKIAEKAAKLALARKLSDQAKQAMIEAEKAAMKVRVFPHPPYYIQADVTHISWQNSSVNSLYDLPSYHPEAS